MLCKRQLFLANVVPKHRLTHDAPACTLAAFELCDDAFLWFDETLPGTPLQKEDQGAQAVEWFASGL